MTVVSQDFAPVGNTGELGMTGETVWPLSSRASQAPNGIKSSGCAPRKKQRPESPPLRRKRLKSAPAAPPAAGGSRPGQRPPKPAASPSFLHCSGTRLQKFSPQIRGFDGYAKKTAGEDLPE